MDVRRRSSVGVKDEISTVVEKIEVYMNEKYRFRNIQSVRGRLRAHSETLVTVHIQI